MPCMRDFSYMRLKDDSPWRDALWRGTEWGVTQWGSRGYISWEDMLHSVHKLCGQHCS